MVALCATEMKVALAAGSVITNQASASYIDASSKTRDTVSNVDSLTTSPTASVVVTKSFAVSDTSGGAGPYGVTLAYSNSGTVSATDLTIADTLPAGLTYVPNSGRWSVTGAQPLSDAVLVPDDQGSAPATIRYDYGTTAASTVTASIAQVPAGSSGTITFQVAVAGSALPGPLNNTATYHYDGGAGVVAASTNTATLNVLATSLSAALTVSASSVAPDQPLTYTLSANNTGIAAAAGLPATVDGAALSAVILRDAIPPGTTLSAAATPTQAGTTALYHIAGTGTQTYASALPAALNTVDAVAFMVPILPSGAQFGGSFVVKVDGNASDGGSVQLNSVGSVAYSASLGTPVSTPSNSVTTTVTVASDMLQLFASLTSKSAETTASIGMPLWIQATAPACNANPTVKETHTIVLTSSSGDRESYTATETGNDTGIFVTTGIATALPPVVAGDGVLEAAGGDTLTVAVLGCGLTIQTTVVLIDPSGEVFDSRTNALIANVTVSLVTASAKSCSQTPATVSAEIDGVIQPVASTTVTDATGAYHFPLVAPGYYCLLVVPPAGYSFPSHIDAAAQPAGRRVLASGPTSGGSYGGVFEVSVATGPVTADVPLDGHPLTGLFAQKTASKTRAEVGDFVDYSISLANNTGVALPASGTLTDALPAGFTYQPNSARLNGLAMAEPLGGQGPSLVFRLPALALTSTTVLTYRVKIGPAAMRGDGVNRAQAQIGTTVSNMATASVHVDGGIFGDAAFVFGKVYSDCNQNKIQDADEVGIPGVRLYLEDGTNVITDSEGKYSVYGLTAKTHVLKLDRTSLPAGSVLEALSNRNSGDPGSVFVDPRNGELHKTDFAVSFCTLQQFDIIATRRKKAMESSAAATEKLLANHLDVDSSVKPLSDVRGLPASGVVGAGAATQGAVTQGPTTSSRDGGFNSLSAQQASLAPATSGLALPIAHNDPVIELEALLPDLDNTLGFIGLKNHDTLPIAQTNVRVKGSLGCMFVLTVNDGEIPVSHVGKKSVLEDRALQAWEYFGVELRPGNNRLQLTQVDQFGNPRGSVSIEVTAPDQMSKLITAVKQEVVADGRSAARILVRLTDANGTPVTVRTPVTLEASLGRWDAEDLDPREPGVQVFIEGGAREFRLIAPQDPGDSVIRVSAGTFSATTHATFLPDLRPLIASGILEGVLNLRRLNTNALTPAQGQDGFEQQLTNLSHTWAGGKEEAAARAAVFLKGKIRGDYLLTLGFDSDKDTQTRLFRDIQPDQFYPVYGDAAIRGFDAQSTSRLYVRIDKRRSWLLYGDLTTQSSSTARQLSNYNRSLTGVKEHYETNKTVVNAFASNDSTTQVIDEIKADGTSGPFVLSRPNLVENSEQVEILLRDRNQPSLIILTTPLQRFVDYELEPLTGTLLLKAPVASLDPNFNPQSIRVTYEVNQNGARFWVAGIDAQYKLTPRLEVGGVLIDDRNPANTGKLEGVNSTVKFGEKTFLVAEVAQTTNDVSGEGTGERVELKRDDGRLQLRAYADKTDLTFDNPGSSVTPGHTESGGKLVYKLTDTLSLRGEAVRSEDATTNGQLNGAMLTAEKRLKHGVRVEVGARKAQQNEQQATAVAQAGAPPGSTTALPTVPPVDLNSLRVKVTVPVPNLPKAAVYGEYEQDVRDGDKKLAALGGEYQVATHTRLYFRDEVISSLSGPDSLNSVQKQNATVFGVDSDYMKDGRAFSEYRVRDAYSGGDAEAAIGLRNRWVLEPGLTATTTAERVHTLSGIATEEATAASFGLDYTANPTWKGSGRIGVRDATDSDSLLVTLGAAAKLDADWTALAREALADSRGTGTATGARKQERLQAGIAFRDTQTNVWNALGLVEHRYETDTTVPTNLVNETDEIVAFIANWQIDAPTVVTLRAAAKWVQDDSNGLSSFAATQLLSARVTKDIAARWDLGVNVSTLFSGANTHQLGLGLEGGYNLAANLWLSAGCNVFGYRETVLTGSDYSNTGVYLRIRFKFDENLLTGATGGLEKPITKPVTGAPP